MKVIHVLLLLFFLSYLDYKSNANCLSDMGSVTINDTIVFDLSQAVYSNIAENYYIEFPVILRSTDPAINAVDYWFQFDLNKLTYVSTTSVIATMDVYTNYNSNNQYLSNTSSTSSINVFLPLDVPIMKLKFSLAAPCTNVFDSDFYSPTTLLNGIVSSYLFINEDVVSVPGIELASSDPLCADAVIEFSYDDEINGQAITSYDWDFDNGSFGSGQNTNTTFSTDGTYTVTLNATTVGGCVNTTTTEVVVLPAPDVDFTSAYDADLNLVTFTNLSTISSGSNVGFDWDFGDGNTSNVFEPTHGYSSNDIYDVSLTVTSEAGCTGSVVHPVNAVSVKDFEKDMEMLTLYPNPTSDYFSIQSNETLHYYIVDEVGQNVTDLQSLSANQTKIVSVMSLAAGFYIFIGYSEHQLVRKRFEIIR